MDNTRTITKIAKLAEKKKSDKIIKFLSSSDTEIIKAALNALCEIHDEDSVNSIAAMIDNPEAEIRALAAKALGGIGTEYAKTYLMHRMTTETDAAAKAAISKALHEIAVNKK